MMTQCLGQHSSPVSSKHTASQVTDSQSQPALANCKLFPFPCQQSASPSPPPSLPLLPGPDWRIAGCQLIPNSIRNSQLHFTITGGIKNNTVHQWQITGHSTSLNTHKQTSILPWESLIQTFHQKICIASKKNWEKIKQQKCKSKVSHNGILNFIFGKLQLQSLESRGEWLGLTRRWLPQTLSRSGLSLTGKNFDKFNENSPGSHCVSTV